MHLSDHHFVVILLATFLALPIVTLLHEVGHAIFLLLNKARHIEIFIGSYGDKEKGWRIKTGKIDWWFYRDLFKWNHGLCKSTSIISNKVLRFFFILGGILMTLLTGLTAWLILHFMNINSFIEPLLIGFILASGASIFTSIIPKSDPVTNEHETKTYNDGKQLLMLFKNKENPPGFEKATRLYELKKYEEAAPIFEQFLAKFDTKLMHQFTYTSYQLSKNYEKADHYLSLCLEKFTPDIIDLYNAAILQKDLGNVEKSLSFFDAAFELDPKHSHSFNGKGYLFLELNRYDEALELLNKAIKYDPNFAFAYNNRGYAKMMLGELEDGLKDIRRSIVLDNTNAYCHRNIGVYHELKGEFAIALEYFVKAKEMDATVEHIDEMIARVEQKIIT